MEIKAHCMMMAMQYAVSSIIVNKLVSFHLCQLHMVIIIYNLRKRCIQPWPWMITLNVKGKSGIKTFEISLWSLDNYALS